MTSSPEPATLPPIFLYLIKKTPEAFHSPSRWERRASAVPPVPAPQTFYPVGVAQKRATPASTLHRPPAPPYNRSRAPYIFS